MPEFTSLNDLHRWLDLRSHCALKDRKAQVQARQAPPRPAPPRYAPPPDSASVPEKQAFFNGLAERIYAKQRARE